MIRAGLIWTTPLLLIILLISAWGWLHIPADAQIPLHWNAAGEVDRYGGKAEGLLVLPAMVLVIQLLMAAVPVIEPRRYNLEKSRQFYLVAWIGTMAAMMLVHALVVQSIVTGQLPSFNLIFIMLGIFLMLTGNYMAKSRSNWFVGLRTPWTL